MAELTGLLAGCRMVTLKGSPGIGKSRLGLQVARRVAGGYPDGAWLVELAAVADEGLVPAAVASALSIHELAGQSMTDTLAARLRRRRLLLVLDNCEHLSTACGRLVEALLAACAQVTVLATSRQPLGIAQERVWRVPPLTVPEHSQRRPVDGLIEFEAVRLFVERARAVEPGFALNAYVAPAVVEICRRLDGIPLAIELAAARVDVLTSHEIAGRLDSRFELLRAGRGPGRHQTLETALDCSYELLSESEQALLRRLSVFAGSYDAEAAARVCAGGELDAGDVCGLLAALVSKSLVAADAERPGRYGLLESIRAYAGDRLERAGEAVVLRGAHARFYLALTEAAEGELTGPAQARWLERLDCERDNLRRALEWSLGHGRGDWALRMAAALVLFWRVRCHFDEGSALLESALAAGEAQAPVLRARALWGVGLLTMMAGDDERAVAPLEQSLAISRDARHGAGCARALLVLANCNQRRPEASVMPLLQESIALARDAGDRWCLSHALGVAGFENARWGELPAARDQFEQCLAVAREAQDDQGLRIGLIGLGSVVHSQGDYGSAETLLEEALAIGGEIGEDYCRGQALHYLGWLALDRGDHARAEALLSEALALLRDTGSATDVTGTLLLLARVSHAAADRGEARRRFDELRSRTGPIMPVLGLLWTADWEIDEGHVQRGRRLVVEAINVSRALGQKDFTAQALHRLGWLARDAGDVRQATVLHAEALEVQRVIAAVPALVASVEALAGLAAIAGSADRAARLLGAADAQRQARRYARLPWESARHDADRDRLRRTLSRVELETALAEGAQLSIEQAAAQALADCGRPAPAAGGWASLTERERQVAALAADGLTNPEIAERLVVSRHTVKRHLAHVFCKLGVTRRGQLARGVPGRNAGNGSSPASEAT